MPLAKQLNSLIHHPESPLPLALAEAFADPKTPNAYRQQIIACLCQDNAPIFLNDALEQTLRRYLLHKCQQGLALSLEEQHLSTLYPETEFYFQQTVKAQD